MALINCPECERQISDKAPACPHCGVPLASPAAAFVATPNAAPLPQVHVTVAMPPAADTGPSEEAPKKTSWGTWLFFALLIAGAIWYFQSPAVRNVNKPVMPVTVGYRPAVTGPGLVLKIENTSDRQLSILATLSNPTLGNTKHFRMDVSPHGRSETGYKEGWALASGDKITLSHDDYQNWDGTIP